MPVTIFHNPRCSKSRQTLALLEDQGIKPSIIEYLKTPITKDKLIEILFFAWVGTSRSDA